AHDRVRLVVQLDDAAQHRSIASETRSPELLTEHGHARPARGILGCREPAAESRRNAENAEQISTHGSRDEPRRLAPFAREREGLLLERGYVSERVALRA